MNINNENDVTRGWSDGFWLESSPECGASGKTECKYFKQAVTPVILARPSLLYELYKYSYRMRLIFLFLESFHKLIHHTRTLITLKRDNLVNLVQVIVFVTDSSQNRVHGLLNIFCHLHLLHLCKYYLSILLKALHQYFPILFAVKGHCVNSFPNTLVPITTSAQDRQKSLNQSH